MDVISDHSEAPGEQSPEPQFDHRIRWGNVALALAALVAIVAAVGLPHGNAGGPTQRTIAPATELITAPVATAPTAEAAKPRPHRPPKRRARRRTHRHKHAAPTQSKPPVPVTHAQTPTPAPAPPAPDQTPAAEREFGL